MKYNKDIFKITHNNLFPAKGRILISEPSLQDLYFQRSVVLLVEHDPGNCSMGFVLNKKTDLNVNDFIPGLEKCTTIPIYLGGPVCPNRLFFIHSLGNEIIPDTVRINENLFFDGDFDILKKYIQEGHPIEGKIKFFLGYSGWTAGQLDAEIDGNSWVVSSPKENSPLVAKDEVYWKDTLALLGQHYKTWINYPKDPLMN